jgi:hypothetical protein
MQNLFSKTLLLRATGLALTAVAALAQAPAKAPPATCERPAEGFGCIASRPPATNGATPRMVDGKPDLSGVWQHPFVQDMTKDLPDQKGEPNIAQLFTPWGKANAVEEFDYTAFCLPLGYTRSINSPMPIEIEQRPGRIVMLYEMNNTFHMIYTDGRAHPKDLEPTWFGHSVGKWDGDTLVIDTVGFNDQTRIDTEGHPHTDKLHVVERLTRTDLGHLSYEMTIDDSGAYTKSWKNVRTFHLRPDWELLEYNCNENNKEVMEGHLKPPAKK